VKKFVAERLLADPDAAARKLVEIANAAEAVQDGRIHIELVNSAFLAVGGTPAEYRAGLERTIAQGWLWRHESGTYVKFTPAGPSCSSDGRKLETPLRRADQASQRQEAHHAQGRYRVAGKRSSKIRARDETSSGRRGADVIRQTALVEANY